MKLANKLFLTSRVDQEELLDGEGNSLAESQRSLEDLRRLNRLLFGVHVTLQPLRTWLRESPKAASVLDVGTGSGQMAQALHRWAARHYQAVNLLALDRSPRHLTITRRYNERAGTPHVRLIAADALNLPLADGSVDYITSSLFLHHLDGAALRRFLLECRRVARRGLVMSDLWRHPLPFYLYKLLAEPLLVRSPITRTDSTISFRRAYRPAEIRRLAAGILPEPQVRLHFPSFRWLLISRWG